MFAEVLYPSTPHFRIPGVFGQRNFMPTEEDRGRLIKFAIDFLTGGAYIQPIAGMLPRNGERLSFQS